MAAAMNSSMFPHFSSLPPELRNQIWRDALPEKDGPNLYPYRQWYWYSRRLYKTDQGYDPNHPLRINLEFRHDLVDHVQVEVPLVFVNREARSIALAWVHDQGIQMRFREDTQCHVFVRLFDPMYDALYIALDKVNDFYSDEPLLRPYQANPIDQSIPDPTCIAVPETLLQSNLAVLSEIFDWFSSLRVLFIIVNQQPNFEENNNSMKIQPRWELDSTRGRGFFWNCDHGDFEWGDGEYIGNEALYKQIEEASKELGEMAVMSQMSSFEIRPVFTVRIGLDAKGKFAIR